MKSIVSQPHGYVNYNIAKRFQCAVPARRVYAFRPAIAALRSQRDNAVRLFCASRDGAIGRHL